MNMQKLYRNKRQIIISNVLPAHCGILAQLSVWQKLYRTERKPESRKKTIQNMYLWEMYLAMF